jgi:hypothetical protein
LEAKGLSVMTEALKTPTRDTEPDYGGTTGEAAEVGSKPKGRKDARE